MPEDNRKVEYDVLSTGDGTYRVVSYVEKPLALFFDRTSADSFVRWLQAERLAQEWESSPLAAGSEIPTQKSGDTAEEPLLGDRHEEADSQLPQRKGPTGPTVPWSSAEDAVLRRFEDVKPHPFPEMLPLLPGRTAKSIAGRYQRLAHQARTAAFAEERKSAVTEPKQTWSVIFPEGSSRVFNSLAEAEEGLSALLNAQISKAAVQDVWEANRALVLNSPRLKSFDQLVHILIERLSAAAVAEKAPEAETVSEATPVPVANGNGVLRTPMAVNRAPQPPALSGPESGIEFGNGGPDVASLMGRR